MSHDEVEDNLDGRTLESPFSKRGNCLAACGRRNLEGLEVKGAARSGSGRAGLLNAPKKHLHQVGFAQPHLRRMAVRYVMRSCATATPYLPTTIIPTKIPTK